jgi:hypothetical protein
VNLCYLRHCWWDWLMCGLLNVVYQLVRRGDLTWLLHLLIYVYMIVQQIDLFLRISLGRISSSSFLLCNKVRYLDLHSKCLKLDWYLTLLFLLPSFGQLQSLFYHTLFLSLSIHLLVWEYIPWNRSVTSYVQLTNLSIITTTSTSSSSSIHSFISIHPFINFHELQHHKHQIWSLLSLLLLLLVGK